MLKRYWGIVGVCLALASNPVFAQQGPASSAPVEEIEGTDAAQQSEWKPFAVTIIESADQAAHDAEREAKSDQHEAEDLAAQQKAADAADRAATAADGQIVPTWFQVAFAAIGSLLLVWTLVLNSRAAHDASIAANASVKAAEAAEKAYLSDNRPWLKLNLTHVGPINFKTRYVDATIVVENVGKSPALNVRMMVHGYIVRIIQIEKTHVKKLVDGHVKNAPLNTLMSALVFANEAVGHGASGRIEELSSLPDNLTDEVGFALVCTAVYRSSLSETYFHTSVTYMVKLTDGWLRTDRSYTGHEQDEAGQPKVTWEPDPKVTSVS